MPLGSGAKTVDAIKNNDAMVTTNLFADINPFLWQPNGSRYPLVGGTRQRHFDGTNLKPQKLLENAATPTSRVVSCRMDMADRCRVGPQRPSCSMIAMSISRLARTVVWSIETGY